MEGERGWIYYDLDFSVMFYVNMENIRIVDKSLKVIKTQLKTDSDIIQYMKEQEILKGSITNIFGDFDFEIQCRIAFVHLGENIKDFGLVILDEMRGNGNYDLGDFFSKLFKFVFPASRSTVEVKYKDLAQNDMTILEYAKTCQTVGVAMGLCKGSQNLYFILGLTDREIRKALLRVDVYKYSFQELIRYATGLENRLYPERLGRESTRRSKYGVKESVKERGDSGAKVSLDYFQLASKKGLKRGLCYNCLTAFHPCTQCPKMKCRFCGKENKEVKHFSLGCPRCPERI